MQAYIHIHVHCYIKYRLYTPTLKLSPTSRLKFDFYVDLNLIEIATDATKSAYSSRICFHTACAYSLYKDFLAVNVSPMWAYFPRPFSIFAIFMWTNFACTFYSGPLYLPNTAKMPKTIKAKMMH